jgi:hypothetical protein
MGAFEESKQSILEINDVDFSLFKKAIEFLYTDKIKQQLKEDEYITLARIGDKYGIDQLKYYCEEYLKDKVSIHNILRNFKLADELDLPLLSFSCKTLILSSMTEIAKTKKYLKFQQTDPHLIEKVNCYYTRFSTNLKK